MRTFLALAAISLSSCAQTRPAMSAGYPEAVTRVIDGDTFAIAARWSPFPGLEWKVRVRGIDTAEKGERAQCVFEARQARRASDLATKLIAQSHYRVRIDQVKHDKYGGRFDARVFLDDGSLLADHMLRAGLAHPYDGGKKPSWCGAL